MTAMPSLAAATPADAKAKLAAKGIEQIHLGIFDIDAKFRERRLPIEAFRDALDGGYSFCNVLHKWDSGDSVHAAGPYLDEQVTPDLATLRPFPFEPAAALCIADYAGASAALSPRAQLQRQIERARALGFGVKAALEFEVILLAETAESLRAKNFDNLLAMPRDNYCWSGITAATQAPLVADWEKTVRALEIELYSLGLELGPGCFEATLKATDPMRAADDAALFKLYSKAFCRQRGLTASFMAQLSPDFPGLSGHVHLSLYRLADGAPVFFEAQAAQHESQTLRHFVGGALSLLPPHLALSAQTVNAYRRMVPGNWAPRTPSWGFNNYTAAIRAVTDRPETARLEFRIPAADTNPYLAIAHFLASGLWGIQRQIEPPLARGEDAREFLPPGLAPLPISLEAAIDALAHCPIAPQLYGQPFLDSFLASRRAEVTRFRREVSAFERARYLESV